MLFRSLARKLLSLYREGGAAADEHISEHPSDSRAAFMLGHIRSGLVMLAKEVIGLNIWSDLPGELLCEKRKEVTSWTTEG